MNARIPFSFVIIKESNGFQTVAGFQGQFMSQDGGGIPAPIIATRRFRRPLFLPGLLRDSRKVRKASRTPVRPTKAKMKSSTITPRGGCKSGSEGEPNDQGCEQTDR